MKCWLRLLKRCLEQISVILFENSFWNNKKEHVMIIFTIWYSYFVNYTQKKGLVKFTRANCFKIFWLKWLNFQLISSEKLFTYYGYKILVIYILVLLFQLMSEENVVKVVLRYAVGSVTVYTIWRLFVFRYKCKPRHFDSWRTAPTTPPSQ